MPDRVQRTIGDMPDVTQLVMEPDDTNLVDLELITTRRGMWIPNSYAALCLEEDLSPVDVWTRVYGMVLQNGHSEAFKPLIEYLQYQLHGTGDANAAIFDEVIELRQPRATPEFLRHRNTVLGHMNVACPNAGTAPATQTTGGTGGGTSAADLQTLMEALRAGHTAPAPAAASATGTIEKRWSVNLPTLLKFCHVNTVQELNPMWAALTRGPRKEERTILGAALNDHVASAQAATSVQFPVTKELFSTIVNLTFWSGDPDSLEEGLHPFRTVYTSTSKLAQDQANLLTYDALAADGTLRLEDVQLFQQVFKSHWPVDYLQLDTTLKLFHNLPSFHQVMEYHDNTVGRVFPSRCHESCPVPPIHSIADCSVLGSLGPS